MGKKPVKIRRYKRSFSGSGDKRNLLRRVAIWVVAALVLFGIGWLVAKPGLDFAAGIWYKYKNGEQTPASSQSVAESEAVSSQSAEPEPSAAPVVTGSGAWKLVSLSSVTTAEQASALAKELAANGTACAVLTLKDEAGNLYYQSAIPQAKSAISAATIDAAAVAKAFADEGVIPVAGIWAFRDGTAPYTDRTMAVKYQDTDYNWLDNSKELGGKPWLNPNSEAAQNYIAEVVREVASLGFQKVLVNGLQFPQGYSLEACGYGNMTQSKEALLAAFGKRLEATEGAEVWFEFPQAALAGEDVVSYGASPAGFGLANVLVRSESRATVNEAGETFNQLPDISGEALGGLKASLEQGGTRQFGWYITGVAGSELDAASSAAKAAGYTVQISQ